MMAGISFIDPLSDPRWDDLLERHPRASVFHSRGWLAALQRTYGYEPVVATTTTEGPLENGLALCRVSRLASHRLVSLPFSDHCDPLVDGADDLAAMVSFLADGVRQKRWSSLELRPRHVTVAGLPESDRYYLHAMDLTRSQERIFESFHPSNSQRAVRRAEREGLSYEAGTSERLLCSFYGLLRQSRRRHGLPPQPLAWFQNLIACLPNRLTIHVASDSGLPVASILTLSFKKKMVYKYGGSDARYHRLGGMPFLFWRAIQGATAQGIEELDLGRSDLDQPGLIAFKDHLGAARVSLTYHSCPETRRRTSRHGLFARAARGVVAHMPNAALDLAGRVLYRHLG